MHADSALRALPAKSVWASFCRERRSGDEERALDTNERKSMRSTGLGVKFLIPECEGRPGGGDVDGASGERLFLWGDRSLSFSRLEGVPK